jgi:hypothetical protein
MLKYVCACAAPEIAASIAAISTWLRVTRNALPATLFPLFEFRISAGLFFMVLSPDIEATKVGLGLESLDPDHFWS